MDPNPQDPDVSAFERAADAIVSGDLPALERLIAANPGLVRERSTREHRGTLLHYVSANGVEDYRQKTPANIVAIATRLLDAGAEVDAEADVYGGGVTTLDLVVTSAHPRLAGVQNALADLLLGRGARLDPGIARSCLLNGCPEAAAHLAARGAPLDLESAAGIGRMDLVARHFEPPGAVSPAEGAAALRMASWYDRRDVIAFLLDRGVELGARDGVPHYIERTGPMATNTVRLHRVLRATPERVYRAFLDPDAMAKWLPPNGFTGKVHQMDARVGGAHRMSFTNFSTGSSHSFGGTYLELVPHERIRYSDRFDDPNLPGEMQVTITIAKRAVGAELTVVQEGIPDVIPPEACYLGWQESLTLLAKLVEAEISD